MIITISMHIIKRIYVHKTDILSSVKIKTIYHQPIKPPPERGGASYTGGLNPPPPFALLEVDRGPISLCFKGIKVFSEVHCMEIETLH